MEKKNLVVKDNKIIIKANEERGIGRQRSFEVCIDDIRIVSLTTKFEFDDEEIYITFATKEGQLLHINFYYFTDEFIKVLSDKFNYKYDSSNIPEEQYERGESKIVFPAYLKGKDLYEVSGINISRYLDVFLRSLRIRPPGGGILTKEVKAYLNTLKE